MNNKTFKVAGFAKVRNEIIREGNLYRLLDELRRHCNCGVVCDDASSDGTDGVLEAFVTERKAAGQDWRMMRVKPEDQDFRKELAVKQDMLQLVHQMAPDWVLWLDGDEEIIGPSMLDWLPGRNHKDVLGYRAHYTQLWRSACWARTDGGFDDGHFVKLWRWNENLSFDVQLRTHHMQFPVQLAKGPLGLMPFEVAHWGNYGKCLQWKVHQYRGGLGGWERHLRFDKATYRPVVPPPAKPQPFTSQETARIEALGPMRALPQTFTVVVPTFNRAEYLDKALQSLLDQTWQKWVAVVVDDGSTDDTPTVMRRWQDADPRIFYVRFPQNRGGVAVNEVGMALACEFSQWWTRLGSDDWFEPRKLDLDAKALLDGNMAVYAPYRVWRKGKPAELCSQPFDSADATRRLDAGVFTASWANAACETRVLKMVRKRFGNFCDPRLRNMEDFLVNVRIAREVRWYWHGLHRGKHYVSPDDKQLAMLLGDLDGLEPQAWWRANPVGASSARAQTGDDDALTRRLIREEAKGYHHVKA